MDKLVTRNGGIKFSRLGPPKFSRQDLWDSAPEPVGLWAFPFPYWDPYFVYHRYDLVVPKRLRTANCSDDWDEREEWIRKYGNKVMPVRHFFYKGYLYSRISKRASHVDYDGGREWEEVHTSELPRLIRKVGGNRAIEYLDGKKSVCFVSKDHLEVFIPRGAGKIFG